MVGLGPGEDDGQVGPGAVGDPDFLAAFSAMERAGRISLAPRAKAAAMLEVARKTSMKAVQSLSGRLQLLLGSVVVFKLGLSLALAVEDSAAPEAFF